MGAVMEMWQKRVVAFLTLGVAAMFLLTGAVWIVTLKDSPEMESRRAEAIGQKISLEEIQFRRVSITVREAFQATYIAPAEVNMCGQVMYQIGMTRSLVLRVADNGHAEFCLADGMGQPLNMTQESLEAVEGDFQVKCDPGRTSVMEMVVTHDGDNKKVTLLRGCPTA